MPNFGRETKGDTTTYWSSNRIEGSFFTGAKGTATSISFYLKFAFQASGKYIKAAIYKKSDNSLVAYTDEWEFPPNYDGFKTLDIAWGGSLEAEDYWLVVWTNSGKETAADVVASKGVNWNKGDYGAWPDTLDVSTLQNFEFPIYCTYSLPPAAAAAAEINPSAFTGYHCFREQFQKRRAAGLIPYKSPDGTLYRDAPSG